MTTTSQDQIRPSAPASETDMKAVTMQVFVRLPHAKRTLPLALSGRETHAEICKLLSTSEEQHTLFYKGRALTKNGARDLAPNATITLVDSRTHLLGGSKPTGRAGADSEDENVYASFELYPNAPEKPSGIPSWTGSADSEYASKPPTITDDQATLGKAKKTFEDEFVQEKGINYTFSYYIKDVLIEIEDDQDPALEKRLSEHGHTNGKVIKVHIFKDDGKGGISLDLSPEDSFLKQITCMKRGQTLKAMKKILQEPQTSFMNRFKTNTLKDNDLKHVLTMLNDHQMDNLLVKVMVDNEMEILKYLLTKAGQWTSISEKMNKNASSQANILQIRRLINTLKNTFSPDVECDQVITRLLQEGQANLLEGIKESMSEAQFVHLLMLILEPSQRAQVITVMESAEIKKFWKLIKPYRRIEIFLGVSEPEQFELLVSETSLSSQQRSDLWDSIGRENRIRMWKLASNPDVQNRMCDPSTPIASRSSINLGNLDLLAPPQANPMMPTLLAGMGSMMANITNAAKKTEIKVKTLQLKRLLLNKLSINQVACLWSVLDEDYQVSMLNLIVEHDYKVGIQLWKLINRDKRCLFIMQLEIDLLIVIFVNMKELEDQAHLLSDLNNEMRDRLKNALTPEKRKQLFYFSHFQTEESTEMTSEDFIESLLKEQAQQSNQHVAFENIEDGFVQCISNPQIKNGFITVQIVEPQYRVCGLETGIAEARDQEVVEEEKNTIIPQQKCMNNTYLMTQNHYGELKETEPSTARNSKKLGIISFYELTENHGIQCTHSFFAEDLVVLKPTGLTSTEIVLYLGLNKEVFFFNKKNLESKNDKEECFELCLQIINSQQEPKRGELSRETSECCFTYLINPASELYDFILNGRVSLKKYTEIYLLNSLPTLIQHGIKKFIVFSHCGKTTSPAKDKERFLGGSTLYFYDVDLNKETKRLKGGEALINFSSEAKGSNEVLTEGCVRIVFLGNSQLMMQQMWKNDYVLKTEEDALRYEASTINERSALVASMVVNFENDDIELLSHSEGRLIELQDEEEAKKGKHWNIIFCQSNVLKWHIDLKDQEIFRQRYLRPSPMIICPHKYAELTGETESFTILFKNIQAFTFGQITIDGPVSDEQKEQCNTRQEQINVSIRQLKEDKEDKASDIQKLEEEKIKLWADASPKYYFYKCKYIVPDASEIIFHKNSANKGLWETYIQVSNRNENANTLARDNIQDVNEFDVMLYDISDVTLKMTIEKIPSKQRKHTVQISREALQIYSKNLYPNKSGFSQIRAIATPLIFNKGMASGAFIYEKMDKQVRELKLEWFIDDYRFQRGRDKIVCNIKQSVNVDYPLMVYKGFVPDNRELVMVNLADLNQPQKIMHLANMQFLCFVSHNNAEREAKVGMLCLEEGYVRLCWIVCSQPYRKCSPTQLSHLKIEKIDIEFEVPILDAVGSIRRIEFVNVPNGKIEDSHLGALLIQTTTKLWLSNNNTGRFEEITNSNMSPVLMPRGFNSHFYFAQDIGDSDCVVNQLTLNYMSGQWYPVVVEILKVNEGTVLAIEIDPDNRDKTDSIYLYNNTLVEERKSVANRIFIVDDKENLFQLTQKQEEDNGPPYIITKELNLAPIKELTSALSRQKSKPFSRAAITERCITLDENNFNFSNGHFWPVKVEKFCYEDDFEDSEEVDYDDQEEETLKKKKKPLDPIQQVNSVNVMRWTSRQLISASFQIYNKKQDRYISSHEFITKLLPGSRRQDLIGVKGLRDCESFTMISNDLFLMRFRGSDLAQTQDYWTVIDSFGQIKPLPEKTKNYLTWSNMAKGNSIFMQSGMVLVLCGGQKRVVSLGSDLAYEEKKISKIRFDRKGEVAHVNEFKKRHYLDSLKKEIVTQLESDDKIFQDYDWKEKDKDNKSKNRKKMMTKKAIIDKISREGKFNDEVICNNDGEIFRIASIVCRGFTDDVAINPSDSWDQPEKINVGIFLVSPKKDLKQEVQGSSLTADLQGKLQITEEESQPLKIILFMCKNKKDQFDLQNSGFVCIGNNLVWSYPQQATVQVVDISSISLIVNEPKENAFTNIFNTLAAPMKIQKQQEQSQPLQALQLQSNVTEEDEFVRQSSVKKSPRKMVALNDSGDSDDNFVRAPESQIQSQLIQDNIELSNSLVTNDASQNNATKAGFQQRFSLLKQLSINDDTTNLASSAVKKIKIRTDSGSEQEEDESNFTTKITWKNFETNVIDLEVLCDNPDEDKLCIVCIAAPKTLNFSIDKTQAQDEEGTKDKKDNKVQELKLQENLLQISVKDRSVMYSLNEEQPKELCVFNAARQFIQVESYVQTGFRVFQAYDDPTPEKDGMLLDSITHNQSQDMCFKMQQRMFFEDDIVIDELPQTPICTGIFKKHAEIDLQELQRIQEKIQSGRIDNIDMQSMLSIYKGHSAFSIFAKEVKFHEQMLTQMQETDFNEEEQEDETMLENNIKRRLYRVLTLQTPDISGPNEDYISDDYVTPILADGASSPRKFNPEGDQAQPANELEEQSEQADMSQYDYDPFDNEQKSKQELKVLKGLQSVLRKSIYCSNARIKDCLLTITNMCNECSIQTFCDNQDDFGEIIKNLSSNAIELIGDSFVNTPFTKKILNTSWHPQIETVFTVRLVSQLIAQKDLDLEIETRLEEDGYDKDDFTKTQVEVQMLDLTWMLADRKNFVNFMDELSNATNDQIYTTELITVLLAEFWEEQYRKILWRCLLPWALYAITTMTFFTSALKGDANVPFCIGLAVTAILLLFYQIFIEIKQSKNSSFKDYVTDVSNMMDVLQYSASLWIMVTYIMDVEFPKIESQRVIAALATLFLWIKVLDWMKLFRPTSFFIRLITETINDIRHFFIIFLVALFMFGVPIYILNLNRGEDNAIMDSTFGDIWILNAFYNQYMLSLGEFSIDAYDGEPQVYLCYILFLLATFFTQITFLNMLIALMGDTYGKVMESQETYALQTQRSIMNDYTAMINDEVDPMDYRPFMIVVKQKQDGEDENGGWEGNIAVIKKTIDGGLDKLQKNVDKKLLAVSQNLFSQQQRDIRVDKDSRGQYVKIMEKFGAVEQRFNAIDVEKTDEIFEIVKKSSNDQYRANRDLKTVSENNERRIEELTELCANDDTMRLLTQMKEDQKELIQAQEESKVLAIKVLEKEQYGNKLGAGAIAQEGQLKDSSKLEEIIAESSRAQSQAIAKLAEQQLSMLEKIQSLETKQESLGQTFTINQANQTSSENAQAQLSNRVGDTEANLMRELQEMKTSREAFESSIKDEIRIVQQQQPAASEGPNSEQILQSMKAMMDQFTTQMTDQQRQVQETFTAQQQADKEEILGKLAAKSSADSDDE